MKVTLFLRHEHQNIKALFNNYKDLQSRNWDRKNELFSEIRKEILLHAQTEVEIFYAALTGTSSTTAVNLISKALEDHDAIEKSLQDLSRMSPSDRTFRMKMIAMMDEVTRHFEREEEEIFGEARRNLPEYRLEELGLEIEKRREILTQLVA